MENKNALIADFMGWDFHKGFFIHREAECIGGANMMRPEELHYHDDWNWLLPVYASKFNRFFGLIPEVQMGGYRNLFYSGIVENNINNSYEAICNLIELYKKYSK